MSLGEETKDVFQRKGTLFVADSLTVLLQIYILPVEVLRTSMV